MAAAPATNLPPTVGRYVLHGEIASGGMATVHFGRLQGAAGFSRSVAIKRLHPQFAKDPDFVAMFVDEARLAARIAHPNVVPTLDIVSQENELLLVMEYVRGASLSRLLRTVAQRGERVPPRIAASIVSGMLRGLHAAHQARSEAGEPLHIVHRDVSPQNVLVGTDGIARVLDFGVAKASGRWQSTREGQLKGKIAYMAAEQITTGNVTRQTDLYAAAVVLWETLTSKRLFQAGNEAKLLSMVLDGEVLPPSKAADRVPEGFDAIVLRGLARDPAKRFATAREMASAVEAIVGSATQTEVGEWVERVAADELRERASRIQEIERSIPTSPSNSLARRAPEPTVVQRALSKTTGGASSPVVSHLAVAAAPPPARWRSKRSIGIGAAALALFAIGMTALSLRAPGAKFDSPIGASVHNSRPVDAIGAAATTSVWTPIPSPGWTPIASATPTMTPPTPTPPPASTPIRAGRPAGTAKPLQNGALRPDCNPPYTMDGKGHIHFKPACVN
jgi:serine/threonine protein kinase